MENLKDIIVLYNKDGARINKPLASLMAQMAKNLPAMQETWVRSLGWKDPLEKGKTTHSSIPAWRIPSPHLFCMYFSFSLCSNKNHLGGILSSWILDIFSCLTLVDNYILFLWKSF